MMEEMAELRQEIAGETSEKLTKKSINQFFKTQRDLVLINKFIFHFLLSNLVSNYYIYIFNYLYIFNSMGILKSSLNVNIISSCGE